MKKIILATAISCFTTISLFAQCSDAGVCSIGRHQPGLNNSKTGSISLGYIFGASGDKRDVTLIENDLTYQTFKLDGEFQVFKDTRIAFGIPYMLISGPEGDNSGIGDLVILVNQLLHSEGRENISISFGGKFPTGKVNSEPMLSQRYQPGLGTTDLLIGINYVYGNINAGLGYQKPFGTSDNVVTKLERGAEFLVRAGYNHSFSSFNLKGEILAILKFEEQIVHGPEYLAETNMVSGTDESQINFLLTGSYRASDNLSLQFQGAVPFLKRDYNYDGLKRSLTLGASVSYRFEY